MARRGRLGGPVIRQRNWPLATAVALVLGVLFLVAVALAVVGA